jgi:hypothetical protein
MQEPTTVPTAESVKPIPFTERVVNLFASPAELFDNVRDSVSTTSNWLIPWSILVIISGAMTFVMMNNASLVDQMTTMMQKEMEKNVAEGRMTGEQVERAMEFTRPNSPYFIILSIGGSVIWTLISLFGLGLIYWLIGKSAMSANAPYMKVVEVVGLTLLISALEIIVTTMLMISLDSLHATPSPGLFVTDFDTSNKVHIALSKLNLFTIWNLVVTGIGLSRLFRRDLPKVLVLVFALWILWSAVSVFTGFGSGR